MAAPKLLPALLGGLFIGVLSSLPFISSANMCCCLWVVCGGALAALLMQQNTPRPVTNGEGAIVGLLAGLVGALVTLVLGVAFQVLMGRAVFDMAEFERAMGDAEMTPEMRELFTGATPLIIIAVVGVFWFIISSAFATLGGLLGALIFRKKTGGPATGGGGTPVPPTFTPPTFNPPAPVAPVPPTFTPPAPPPPASLAPPVFTPPPPPAPAPPPSAWGPPPVAEEYTGDAPTILIPARGPVLPPAPPAPPPAAPPSGAPPPPDREPESH
jgi:hypothetical protein